MASFDGGLMDPPVLASNNVYIDDGKTAVRATGGSRLRIGMGTPSREAFLGGTEVETCYLSLMNR